MGLRPVARIEVGGEDITGRLGDRLLRITLTDNSGEEADEVELEIDDRDYAVEEPRRGVALTVSIGFEDTGLTLAGRFVVDETWPEGPPDRLMIKAKAADMRGGLKAGRTRAWSNTTIGQVVSEIAQANGLDPAVDAELASRPVAHRDQTNESDLHFLTRLARDHGAVAAPKNGRLVFTRSASGTSATGQALAEVALSRGDLIDWKGGAADRPGHGQVRARWRDMGAAQTRFATAGDGKPVRTLRRTYPDKASAEAAVAAEQGRLGQASGSVELTMEGRPEIAAQTPITLSGLRPSMNRRWIVTKVEHALDLSSGGFTTRVEANATGKAES